MQSLRRTQLVAGRIACAFLLLVSLSALASTADARPRHRHRRPSALSVALQPFRLARSAVHAVAEPIVVAPLRIAYLTNRTLAKDDGARPISGSAALRNGIAIAPANAPARVKEAIEAANTLRRKPYVWGGGHGTFSDRGYDCSGTVSFSLHGAGALETPLPSSEFMRYGERGRGRWITIYSRPGHTFAVIAGLRLDTTDFQTGGNVGPRWHLDLRDTGGYVARHPVGM